MGNGVEGTAYGTHEFGSVAAQHGFAGEEFEGTHHRVVLHRTSLHHDVVAQHGGVGEAQHLEEAVLHHRVGEPRSDVGHGSPLAELLLHLRIHEYGAACAEVAGVLGDAGLVGKVLERVA